MIKFLVLLLKRIALVVAKNSNSRSDFKPPQEMIQQKKVLQI